MTDEQDKKDAEALARAVAGAYLSDFVPVITREQLTRFEIAAYNHWRSTSDEAYRAASELALCEIAERDYLRAHYVKE